MPIGMPGWPDLAASTASMASARMALASSASVAREPAGKFMGAANYTRRMASKFSSELPFGRPAGFEQRVFCEAPGAGHWFVFRGSELLVELGPPDARPSDDP